MGGIGRKCLRQWGRDRMAAEGSRIWSVCTDEAWRQWGRDRMAAEGGRRRRRGRRPCLRQWGRDRMAAEGRRRRSWCRESRRASMGPRPDGRGRLLIPAGLGQPDGASMGPRPDGRGRDARRHAYGIGLWLRQWGRDRMAAEGTAPDAAPMPSPIRRQWGRDRMAAEGSSRSKSSSPMITRQWGRDRMAAEGFWRLQNLPPPAASVNGAATGWPRKAAPAAP